MTAVWLSAAGPPLAGERNDRDLGFRHAVGHCAHPGRVLLPLVDQEPGRQADRHENLRTWGVDRVVGERLIEVFAALVVHAVVTDAFVPTAELDALPLRTVANAATGKRDFEFLSGLPHTFTDDRDEQAANLFCLPAR